MWQKCQVSGYKLLLIHLAAQRDLAIFDYVRAHESERGHTASYYYEGQDPATPFLCCIYSVYTSHLSYLPLVLQFSSSYVGFLSQ